MKEMKRILLPAILIGLGLAGLFAASCSSERIEPKAGEVACDTSAVSYQADIQPIIQVRCINQGCHCNGCDNTTAWPATALWDNFDRLKERALNGELVKHLDGTESPRMPLNRPQLYLEPCDVDKFRRWVAAGAPNN